MNNRTLRKINQCILSVCIEKESLERFKPILDRQPGIYSKCEAFVTAYRDLESSRALSNVGLKKLDFLGRQVGLTDDSLQLLKRALKGESVSLATTSFLPSAKENKAGDTKEKDRTALKERPKEPVSKRMNLRTIIGIAAAIVGIVLLLTFSSENQEEVVRVIPEAKAAPTPEERLKEAVNRMEMMAEFGTVEYTVSCVHIESNPTWHSEFTRDLGKKTIVIEFQAKVVAGIDLSVFSKEQNVRVSDDSVIIELPKAKILYIGDPEHTKVYAYSGILRSDYDWEDKDEVKGRAMSVLEERVNSGQYPILKDAEDNARSSLTMLLKELGFTSISIKFV